MLLAKEASFRPAFMGISSPLSYLDTYSSQGWRPFSFFNRAHLSPHATPSYCGSKKSSSSLNCFAESLSKAGRHMWDPFFHLGQNSRTWWGWEQFWLSFYLVLPAAGHLQSFSSSLLCWETIRSAGPMWGAQSRSLDLLANQTCRWGTRYQTLLAVSPSLYGQFCWRLTRDCLQFPRGGEAMFSLSQGIWGNRLF